MVNAEALNALMVYPGLLNKSKSKAKAKPFWFGKEELFLPDGADNFNLDKGLVTFIPENIAEIIIEYYGGEVAGICPDQIGMPQRYRKTKDISNRLVTNKTGTICISDFQLKMDNDFNTTSKNLARFHGIVDSNNRKIMKIRLLYKLDLESFNRLRKITFTFNQILDSLIRIASSIKVHFDNYKLKEIELKIDQYDEKDINYIYINILTEYDFDAIYDITDNFVNHILKERLSYDDVIVMIDSDGV